MLEVRQVTKRFGSHVVIKDASICFGCGVTGLIAPNGAGKTTLIKMLATLQTPSAGQILLDGEDIYGLGEAYRARLGYLPQQVGVYPSYTPRRFLRYIAALQRVPRGTADARIDELLDLVGLSDVANKRMRAFSGGMIQRVGIAQALIAEPDILLLDEPTAGLDPRERVRFRSIIHRLAVTRTVILSTHIVSDIETIAGQIVLMRDGRVHVRQSASELTRGLAGRIIEVPVDAPECAGEVLLGEREGEAGPVRRVALPRAVAQGELGAGASVCRPTLEDAFLLIYRDGRDANRAGARQGAASDEGPGRRSGAALHTRRAPHTGDR